jgi:hypothetical protein
MAFLDVIACDSCEHIFYGFPGLFFGNAADDIAKYKKFDSRAVEQTLCCIRDRLPVLNALAYGVFFGKYSYARSNGRDSTSAKNERNKLASNTVGAVYFGGTWFRRHRKAYRQAGCADELNLFAYSCLSKIYELRGELCAAFRKTHKLYQSCLSGLDTQPYILWS